jgi:hypothetical protein
MQQEKNTFKFDSERVATKKIKKVIVQEEKQNSGAAKVKRSLLASLVAIAGMVGIYYNIEYSGWLIFAGFCIQLSK